MDSIKESSGKYCVRIKGAFNSGKVEAGNEDTGEPTNEEVVRILKQRFGQDQTKATAP